MRLFRRLIYGPGGGVNKFTNQRWDFLVYLFFIFILESVFTKDDKDLAWSSESFRLK